MPNDILPPNDSISGNAYEALVTGNIPEAQTLALIGISTYLAQIASALDTGLNLICRGGEHGDLIFKLHTESDPDYLSNLRGKNNA